LTLEVKAVADGEYILNFHAEKVDVDLFFEQYTGRNSFGLTIVKSLQNVGQCQFCVIDIIDQKGILATQLLVYFDIPGKVLICC